jgi:hypothetical protein
MALTKRVKQGFLRLSMAKKVVLLSSGALMVSAVLPWYDNRNSFGVGETFLGVQGPLFLLGIFVFSFGAISFFNIFLPLLGKNFFKLKRKIGAVAMMLGAQSLFLLLIANSVFYHPSFGTNISHKGIRFGMLVAFISIGFMVSSGWLTHRREKKGEFDEEMEDFMVAPEPAPAPEPIQHIQSATKPLTYGTYEGDPLKLDAKTRYKMMKQQQRRSTNAQENLWGSDSEQVRENMKIRTDL